MTAPPVDPATLARLRLVATWDGTAVEGARSTFADVVDRLSAWRARLDGLGRAVGDAECWSGPAADVAAAALRDVSRVATAVQAAFDRSQEGWNALGAHAPAAQALAERALVLAALADSGPPGWPVGSPGVAHEALAAAAAAAAAARSAEDAVTALAALVAGSPPPAVPDLLARLEPLTVPAVPAGLSAPDVAVWWGGLSAAEQELVVQRSPAAVGSLDGVPAWARDRANRLLLDQVLEAAMSEGAMFEDAAPADVARAARQLDARIRAEEAAGRTVQLHLLDLAGDRVVLSLGDLDTADTVVLLVPGVLTTPDDDLGALVGDARAVAAAAVDSAPGLTVAAVVWLGYRTPQTLRTMTGRATAVEGGRTLDAALDGLAAARTASGSPPARTTVLAHSYGTVVVDEAADHPGRLAADAVVLLGSPGMEGVAADLEAAEVYDAGSAGDVISWMGWFGLPPGVPAFGSTALPNEPWAGHSDYYDTDGPTLAAIGEVVSGARDPD